MKRTHASSRLMEVFVKAGLIAALTAAFLVPTTVRVQGAETAQFRAAKETPSHALPLPPIRNLESMRLLDWHRSPGAIRIDLLIRPNVWDESPQLAGSASNQRG